MGLLEDGAAAELVKNSSILWYQRFRLSDNVVTPGSSAADLEETLERAGLPERLDGLSVLDIGTSNGGAAFIAEARGASRVVAVDLCAPDWFGFEQIRVSIGSNAHFVQASVYELPELLNEQFDVVFFLGVLYHLRHPLLAIDALHELTAGRVYAETAVAGEASSRAEARFFRRDEMSGDGTNWFVPTLQCFVDWFASSGFSVSDVSCWPEQDPTRALLVGEREATAPEYTTISYEAPLVARTHQLRG